MKLTQKDLLSSLKLSEKPFYIFVPHFGEFRNDFTDVYEFWEKLGNAAYNEGIEMGKRLKEQEIKQVLNIKE